MLGDDIAAALPGLREHALSMMVDTCEIARRQVDANGEPVRELDPVTLELTDVWDAVHSGPCRVQRWTGQGMSNVVAGGYEFGNASLMVQLPIDAVGIRSGDRVEITDVSTVSDPALLGAVAWVKDDMTKSHATKRTLACEEVSP